MADYPSSIADPRTVTNVAGVVYDAEETSRLFAEDVNNANEEIVAIEETLGINPQGDEATVADRLASLEAAKPILFTFPSFDNYDVSGAINSPTYLSFRILASGSINDPRYLSSETPYGFSSFGEDANITLEFSADINSFTNAVAYMMLGSEPIASGSFGVGFKVVGTTLYACEVSSDENGDPEEFLNEIAGVSISSWHRYKIVYSYDLGNTLLYIDDVLVYTIELHMTYFENVDTDKIFTFLCNRAIAGSSPYFDIANVCMSPTDTTIWPSFA